ncbi:MAG: hypothetical protein LBC65_00365, partial [Oscillospiraceae bacterium]|nr:hypothetical protein [Oscillospiraceae bacterium]
MAHITVHAKEHDSAMVVSAEFEIEKEDVRDILEVLKGEMELTGKRIAQSGSILGHLKASVAPHDGSYALSTTGEDVSLTGGIAYYVGITGIVMLTELNDARAHIEGL